MKRLTIMLCCLFCLLNANAYEHLAASNSHTSFLFQGKEILRIDNDGRTFWHGHEVQSDAEFRKAMLDVRDFVHGECRTQQ